MATATAKALLMLLISPAVNIALGAAAWVAPMADLLADRLTTTGAAFVIAWALHLAAMSSTDIHTGNVEKGGVQ